MAMSDLGNAADPAPVKPRRWWQWFLLYPALLITIVTALPQIVDSLSTAYTNLTRAQGLPAISSLSDAKLQAEMWQHNLGCNTLQHSWQDTVIGIKVDTTICPDTGDVLVQALGPDHKQHARWISAKEQIVEADDARTASIGLGLSEARAAELQRMPFVSQQTYSQGNLIHKIQFQKIICQKQIGQRTLLRRIAGSGKCSDVLIDMYTGLVIRQAAAPCVPHC
jgi:hypothetical protein